jgi:DNA modification methylase
VQLRQGDALDLAAGLEDHSIDAIVTSPPYFQQRAYSDDPRQPGAVDQDLPVFLDYLVGLFRALRPKLTAHAAIWLNVGARHAGGGFGIQGPGLRPRTGWQPITGDHHHQAPPEGHRERDLLPLPYLVGEALRTRVPLIWRSEVIWSKLVATESPRLAARTSRCCC